MATSNVCDLCGEPAVDRVEVKSNLTTAIVKDVCEKHLAEFKRIMRVFLGQELSENDAAIE